MYSNRLLYCISVDALLPVSAGHHLAARQAGAYQQEAGHA
jgi:hypothetical protein